MRTYGTLKLEQGRWVLEAEPHVMIRLKRIFHRVHNHHGRLQMRDGDEICRDLAWVLERYPLELDAAAAEHLARRARRFDAEAEAVAALLNGKIAPKAFDLALPAREYQRVAADLALRMGGLLIADDVGLGKTATAICALTDPSTRPALVVTLTHLPRQWEAEIRKFAPGLRTHIIKKGSPYQIVKGPPKDQVELVAAELPDVLIINYHKLSGWAETLAGVVRGVVFDEVQELRHSGSKKADAAEYIASKARLRIGLSATPIYNYGQEMFNVVEVLRPGALGTMPEFITEWCTGVDQQGRAKIYDPKAFGSYVREASLMLRRTRADVGRELPDLSKVAHHVDTDAKALEDVAGAADELARLILEQGGMGFDKMRAAEELSWKLRQATGIAKAKYVAEFVRLLVDAGEKVVLYGWHREVYGIWKARLEGLGVAFYTGTESPTQKEAARKAFVEGDAQVLVMSLRAGAGLDGLQAVCRTVVFGELDWSPGVHEQCVGRVYRDGQASPVVAYYLVADEGSDPVVVDVLGVKRAQVEGIRNPDGELIEKLDAGAQIKKLAEHHLKSRGLEVPAGKEDQAA